MNNLASISTKENWLNQEMFRFSNRFENTNFDFLASKDLTTNEIFYLERIGDFDNALAKSYLAAILQGNQLWQVEAMCILIAHGRFDQAKQIGMNLFKEKSDVVNKILKIIDYIQNYGMEKSFKFRNIKYTFNVSGQNWEIDDVFIDGRFYELKEIELIRRFIPDNGVFLDIGANVGNHSIFINKNRPDVKIIPIEPEPRAVSLLKSNIRLNKCNNINTNFLGYAMSCRPGFSYLQWRSSITSTHISLRNGELIEEGIKVPCILLQEIICKNAFLKLDIEGMERFILNDAKDILIKNKPTLMIECLNSHKHNKLNEMLDGINFEVRASIDLLDGHNHLIQIL